MSSSAPSLEEFLENSAKHEDCVSIMDDEGKLKVVPKAEARGRQDWQVFTKFNDKKAGGFFNWITYMSRAENF